MLRFRLSTLVLFILPFVGFADALDGFLFTVQCNGQEAGSGFLLHDRGTSWLISNCHVVEGHEEVVFVGMTDSLQTFELPARIQVAENRDAVRFSVDAPNGFRLGDDCSFDEEVYAFGNSDGKGIITKSAGKVVGKGRGEIEVTCEIIPGNSGGPVINGNDEVIGLATFLMMPPSEYGMEGDKFKIFEGTRYEEARRIAIPLHDAKWQEVELTDFQKESVKAEALIAKCNQFYEVMFSILLQYPLNEENGEILSRSWARSYNRKLSKCGHNYTASRRYVISRDKKDSFDRALRNWLEDLSEKAVEISESLHDEAEDFMIKYYQQELLEQAGDMEGIAKKLLEAAEDD